jgi:hypothetical protein
MNDSSFISRSWIAGCGPGLLFLLGCGVIGPVAHGAETAADTKPETVAAVWKPQEIAFHYQSFTTFYSCPALEARVELILLALGADKRSLNVRASGCEMGRIAKVPYVRIRMTSPVEATPKVLAELESTRSKRELAARVRGERPPETDEQFDAYWKPVALFRSRLRLDPGDCPLVEQMQREVFPKIGVRVVKDQMNCMPNQTSLTMPRLDVEALMPVEQADPNKAQSNPSVAPRPEPAPK